MLQAIWAAVIVLLTAVDRLTKYAAVSTVKVNGAYGFLPGFIRFRYVENTGAAFSMLSDKTFLLTVATVIILAVCLVVIFSGKLRSKFAQLCLVIIVSGGIGNVIDRILYGFVVDFIEPVFVDFAVFNFADCCITVGAFMLIGYEIYDLIKTVKEKNND